MWCMGRIFVRGGEVVWARRPLVRGGEVLLGAWWGGWYVLVCGGDVSFRACWGGLVRGGLVRCSVGRFGLGEDLLEAKPWELATR